MTELQLFQELTYVDVELLADVEQYSSQKKYALSRSTILLVAVICILTFLLVGCGAAYFSGALHGIFQAPLSDGQVQYLHDREQLSQQNQESDGWKVALLSSISDARSAYLIFQVTAPEHMNLEQYLDYSASGDRNFSMENRGCNHDTEESTVTASVGNVDVGRNFRYMYGGAPAPDHDGEIRTVYYSIPIRCEPLDPSNAMILQDPFGPNVHFQVCFTDIILASADCRAENQGNEVLLASGLWNFDVTFVPDSQSMELITKPVPTEAIVCRHVDGTFPQRVEQALLRSFELTPLGADICFAYDSDTVGISIGSDPEYPIYAYMLDGTRVRLCGTGFGTRLIAEAPIIFDQLDYVLLGDGTILSAADAQ